MVDAEKEDKLTNDANMVAAPTIGTNESNTKTKRGKGNSTDNNRARDIDRNPKHDALFKKALSY